ncbi:MAG: cobyric acid synthase [Clostridium sp.]|uniref:cobyric acid synthase n=1 Tax=Clostridium sp. TaxID=1506 RepID=UPI003D6D9BBF
MAKIMVQGTASSVGKSILVTALCRIFKQDGFTVCPYKSQNMSLNSYITLDGKEMARAQVLQAYAAGLEPEAYMNPILLKPSSDKKCQVIVKGKVYCNSSAQEYHNMKLEFSEMLKFDFKKIERNFEIVVIEGAGSPAEINLRDRDIVNMGLAELIDAPVILVGDIDKGGVFAALAGTMLLLEDNEKKRVKGTIINKFRGDIEILKPGLTMIEDMINVPCLGVVPSFNLQLEDEDGALEFNKKATKDIDIAVIKLPHISNFTDFDALKIEDDVSVRFITSKEEFGCPDLLIIPGSKNTIEDLLALKNCGLLDEIKCFGEKKTIIGICGGYQMLGSAILDPNEVETSLKYIEGMKLLDIITQFEDEKVTTRIEAKFNNNSIYGYEIHMGVSTYGKDTEPLFTMCTKNGESVDYPDGAINKQGNIMGTYIHGIFDGIPFREMILNKIREEKGLCLKEAKTYESLREKELDKLALIVRNNIDMKKIYKIINL